MSVERTQLRRSPQSSPTHLDVSQTLTALKRTAALPIDGGYGDTVHGTRISSIERFLAVSLPPPLFMIRFR